MENTENTAAGSGAPASSGVALPPALVLLAAIAAGAAMDATIKHLTHSNHVLTVVFGRYLFGAMFSLAIWHQAGRPAINAEMWRVHGLRGAIIAACATTFFWALSVLPLAEAVTLSFLYPLLAPFTARLFLGERVRPVSVICALIGFAGVIVAVQGAPPQSVSPLHNLGVAAVLVSAVFFSLAVVLLRARAARDGAAVTGLMTSLVPGAILLGPALLFSTPPHLPDWPAFLLMGALAAGFMFLMVRAYARAEAQQLAPIHYTELVWASLFGYFIFHETPRPEIYWGAGLIVAACLLATYDERRLARANGLAAT